MSLIIPPGYSLASIEYWLTGYTRPAVTTWGLDTRGDLYDPDTMARGFLDAYEANCRNLVDTNVTVRNAKILIGQDGGEPVIGVSTHAWAGTSSRASTPPALSVMLKTPTGLGGRRNRGRKYIPWSVAENSVDEMGLIDGASVTALQTGFNAFYNDLKDSDWDPVVLHSTGSSPVPSPTPITAFVVDPIIRTQKQRQARF